MKYLSLTAAFVLCGCASAADIRSKAPDLDFSVVPRAPQRFVSCVYDGLQLSEGGVYAISNSSDSTGTSHLMARIAGHNTAQLFEWDVAITPTAPPGGFNIQRRSNSNMWGRPMGASDIRKIVASCS